MFHIMLYSLHMGKWFLQHHYFAKKWITFNTDNSNEDLLFTLTLCISWLHFIILQIYLSDSYLAQISLFLTFWVHIAQERGNREKNIIPAR